MVLLESKCDLSGHVSQTSLVAQMVKSLPAMREMWVQFLVGKIPWRRARQPTPVFLSVVFRGQRSLAGYSLWGPKESDTAKPLAHTHISEARKVQTGLLIGCFHWGWGHTVSLPRPSGGAVTAGGVPEESEGAGSQGQQGWGS